MATASDLLDALYKGAAPCPHVRVNHARGILLSGEFLPSPRAAVLCKASVFQAGAAVATFVRFSNSGPDAKVADNDPKANPRGMALRLFADGEPVLDIVGHSSNGFPARTPDEFLAFLHAVNASKQNPMILTDYLTENPAASHFLSRIPPTPSSYVAERYFPLHAIKLTDAKGRETIGRFRLDPLSLTPLNAAMAAKVSPNFLQDDVRWRAQRDQCRMKLMFQVAAPQDDPSDISIPWPDRREAALLGEVRLTSIEPDDRHRDLVFDPGRLPSGIEASGDPMLGVRSEAYRLSFARRLAD